MRSASIVFAAALALLAVPSHAQQPQPAAPFGETIEVRVVNVDVMVTDKSGKPVTGLTRDDFELFESGRKVDITNFSQLSGASQTATLARTPQPGAATNAAASPAAEGPDVRSRKVVLFLDNSTLTPASRAKAVAAAKAFVAEAIRPSDQVMIVTWNPGLKVNADFTNDAAAAGRTLNAITSGAARGGETAQALSELQREMFDIMKDWVAIRPESQRAPKPDDPPIRPPIRLALDHAATFAMREQHAQREVAGALRSVISAMRAADGRKAVVFISERLDENPASPFYDFLESVRDHFDGGDNVNFQSEADAYRDRDLVESIAALANGSGVTLYPMHAGGGAADVDSNSAESNGMNYSVASRRANVLNGSFPAMQRLASETGGVALTGTTNFTLGFANVMNDLTAYYSLGFRATGPRQDAVRPLTVKLKNPRGLQVRMRPQYIEKSALTEMNDTVSANLFFPITRNDLGITIALAPPQPAPDNQIALPLDIRIPTSSLTLVPQGTDVIGHFAIFVGFVRGNGAVAKVTRHEHQVQFAADTLKRRKEVTVKTTLTIDSATDAISVGVMDDLSKQTGFATVKLNAPAPAAAGKTQ